MEDFKVDISKMESEMIFLENERNKLLSLTSKLELLGVNVESIKIADSALLEKIDRIKALLAKQ